MLAAANAGKKKKGGFGKNAGEWTGRVEISQEDIPGGKRRDGTQCYIGGELA